jgi:perosamine synthetase
MRTIRLHPPVRNEHAVVFSWSVEPESDLYRGGEFELRFPATLDIARVPDALWWRVALACLHTQWPLLRPCRVLLPIQLPPGEREFWARMCDSEVWTLEAHAGGRDVERTVDIVEAGPLLAWPEAAPPASDEVVACFSGGRDSLTQAALLQELGVAPLLVTVDSPQPGHIEHQTTHHDYVMQAITERRGLELVTLSSTLRSAWNNRFAWSRYEAAVSELTDTFLYAAAATAVAAARGARAVFLASEGEVQETALIGGRIVQHKHFMYSAATQRALSMMLAPLGIRYSGLTYPLRQFQVQRVLNRRYTDLSDLQYSCWSMTADQRACSRCGECRVNAFNLMADGRAPAEIGIDVVELLEAQADWRPRTEERDATLPHSRWASDMQMVRCLDAVTPEIARGYIGSNGGVSARALAALERYSQMRERALEHGVESEPGYRPGFLTLIDERFRPGLEAIFDEHFDREPEQLHADAVARSATLSDWISAPLRRPELEWRPIRRPVAASVDRPLVPRPPRPAAYGDAELADVRARGLVPGSEPALAASDQPLRVATTSLTGNELRYVTECVQTNWVSSAGSFVTRFEQAFAAVAGCRHAVACSSGTTALHLALAAAGIGAGDEVIVPTFTMIASPNAIGYVGATPVFVDTDPDTWNLDLSLARDLIGPRTRAIMIVHTYGHPVDADAVRALADANGLVVIEDAAEAHGASFHGRRAGSLGTVGAFSFYGNKIVTTGEGGMVTTSDDAIAAVARELRDHGFSTERHFWHRFRAFNFRISNLQAAVGLAQVERLDELLGRRRRTALLYREALAGIPGLELPPTAPGHDDANWMFGCVVVDEFGLTRDELRRRLAAEAIETRTFFVPIHVQPAYHGSQRGRRFPVAERLGANGLYLPSGPEIGEAEVARVAGAITRARARTPKAT